MRVRDEAFDAERFRRLGAADPEDAAARYDAWLDSLRGRSESARRRKIIEIVSGKGSSTVAHYMSPNFRHRLSTETRRRFAAIDKALGHSPAESEFHLPAARHGARRISLVTDFSTVVSPRYHLEVLRRIVAHGSNCNCSVALHDVPSPVSERQSVVARIARIEQPHGMIWFRITPDQESLQALHECSPSMPVVVVHGARLAYPPPVIGHVTPDQTAIRTTVERWLARSTRRFRARPVAVIVRMARERSSHDSFARLPGCEPSIRNERIAVVEQCLRDAGLQVRRCLVQDYSASRALPAFQRYPNADFYVCLSDEIAVGIQQVMVSAGRPVKDRILGFDGSELARAHRIPSIDQGLPTIGRSVFDLFTQFFRQPSPSFLKSTAPAP